MSDNYCKLWWPVSAYFCVCEPGYIRNQDTGECSTQLCDDERDWFCMNHGSCNDALSSCSCHREYTDPNCETCKLLLRSDVTACVRLKAV